MAIQMYKTFMLEGKLKIVLMNHKTGIYALHGSLQYNPYIKLIISNLEYDAVNSRLPPTAMWNLN